jgi:hypothetical protein
MLYSVTETVYTLIGYVIIYITLERQYRLMYMITVCTVYTLIGYVIIYITLERQYRLMYFISGAHDKSIVSLHVSFDKQAIVTMVSYNT